MDSNKKVAGSIPGTYIPVVLVTNVHPGVIKANHP